jgi:DNA-binding transcriptional regulator YhcF (GntR family)
MEIRIDKGSEIPVRQQLAEHIIFAIATGTLKPGEALPSVRELARRLKIHHNTVSGAYKYLVSRTWLVGRRGSRVVVQSRDKKGDGAGSSARESLDDLINGTIRVARQNGYSLQALRERVRTRLLAEAPDHVLVVEDDPGLRRLLQAEITAATGTPAEGCSLAELAAQPGLAIGALTATGHYCFGRVEAIAPKTVPPVCLAFSGADEHLEVLRKLAQPSVVTVVSVSAAFLETARGLLGPVLGKRHVMRDFRFPLEDSRALGAADVVFADSVSRPHLKHKKLFVYKLVARDSMEYLCSAMKSYQMR